MEWTRCVLNCGCVNRRRPVAPEDSSSWRRISRRRRVLSMQCNLCGIALQVDIIILMQLFSVSVSIERRTSKIRCTVWHGAFFVPNLTTDRFRLQVLFLFFFLGGQEDVPVSFQDNVFSFLSRLQVYWLLSHKNGERSLRETCVTWNDYFFLCFCSREKGSETHTKKANVDCKILFKYTNISYKTHHRFFFLVVGFSPSWGRFFFFFKGFRLLGFVFQYGLSILKYWYLSD